MTAQHAWTVGDEMAGTRLDQYVLSELQFRYSRAQIQRWLVAGFVRVNGARVPAHRRVKAGDAIAVDLAAAQSAQPVRTLAPEPIPLTIVHEDDELLVVDKPAGLVTHPAPGHWTGTLVNAVLWHLQQKGNQFRVESSELKTRMVGCTHSELSYSQLAQLRPGIVHRLDKDTSGLLVIAKTEPAHLSLAKQLKARTMRRVYLACVEGLLALDEGTVNVPIGRHLTDRKRMTVRHLGGRAAVTHYRVLRRVPTSPLGPYTVVECRLDTGRTHQVRVHMAHLGHPVLGDATYGKTTRGKLPRHYLHAARLTFQHPTTHRMVELTAKVPGDMVRFVEGETLGHQTTDIRQQ